MNSFESDVSDDNHICIRCKQTINGLDNYIEHRKSGRCPHMTADKFFNCLQLQYKYKSIYDSNEDEEEEEDEDTSVKSVANDRNQLYSNSDEDQSEEEEEEIDIYRPPNNFTGGKWKPGTHPQSSSRSTTGHTSYISDSSSDGLEVFNAKKCKNSDQILKNCEQNHSLDSNRTQTEVNISSKAISGSYNLDNCQQSEETVPQTKNIESNELFCKICDYSGNNSFDLLKHYLNSSNHSSSDVLSANESDLMRKLSFICQICLFYTNQSNNYFWHLTTSNHIQKLNSRTTHFECKACDQRCEDVEELMTHLEYNQSVHSKTIGPLIYCKVNKIIENRNKSVDCQKQTFDSFKCDFCGKLFEFKTHLKQHRSQHFRRFAFPDLIRSNFIGDNPKYSCLKCDFKTDREATHLLHSVNHQIPVQSVKSCFDKKVISNRSKAIRRTEDKYKCPLCQKTYICRQLKPHINSHLNEKHFECIQCHKKFSKLEYLKNHEKSHSNIKDKICQTCGQGFTLNRLLKNHMKIHDIQRKRTETCDICGVQFYTKFQLIVHKKRHLPKTERQFKCDFPDCRYAFIKKSELLEHSKSHWSSDEKPFLCDRCPYKTKSIFTLRRHCRQHTGEKPFKCKFCDFTTNSSSNLCRHIRIHTGDKPYGCPYCSYVCNTQENIRKHILKTKKHKGLHVYPCNHCDYRTNLFIDYRKHIEESHSDLYTNEEINHLLSHLFRKK